MLHFDASLSMMVDTSTRLLFIKLIAKGTSVEIPAYISFARLTTDEREVSEMLEERQVYRKFRRFHYETIHSCLCLICRFLSGNYSWRLERTGQRPNPTMDEGLL